MASGDPQASTVAAGAPANDGTILVVDDDFAVREVLGRLLRKTGLSVVTASSGAEALTMLDRQPADLVVTDLNMAGMNGLELLGRIKAVDPSVEVVLITAYGSTGIAVEAMKLGAFDYVAKPFDNDELILVVQKALSKQRTERENILLKRELGDRAQFGSLVGTSTAMLEVYELIRKVKDTRINVLITGESGTGKELVARAIHYSGARRNLPFVSVNCGAIPEGLMESELFGHRRGAFTGAHNNKEGLFHAAREGTLFLDEIGELALSLQVKLLRAIQERRIRPVGAVTEEAVDVRIVAATNRDLQVEVQAGRFREDLFYRLNVVPIRIPPLRDRRGDVARLVDHFIRRHSTEYGRVVRGIAPDAMAAMEQYAFPGNVRELDHVMERAVALGSDPWIVLQDLPDELRRSPARVPSGRDRATAHDPSLSGAATQSPVFLPGGVMAGSPLLLPSSGLNLEAVLEEYERSLLQQAMEACAGRKKKAADLLQISFRSFRYRLAKLGMVGDDDTADPVPD